MPGAAVDRLGDSAWQNPGHGLCFASRPTASIVPRFRPCPDWVRSTRYDARIAREPSPPSPLPRPHRVDLPGRAGDRRPRARRVRGRPPGPVRPQRGDLEAPRRRRGPADPGRVHGRRGRVGRGRGTSSPLPPARRRLHAVLDRASIPRPSDGSGRPTPPTSSSTSATQGKRSYYLASTLTGEHSEVFRRLSVEFDLCAFGLSKVRREWERFEADRPAGGGPMIVA